MINSNLQNIGRPGELLTDQLADCKPPSNYYHIPTVEEQTFRTF